MVESFLQQQQQHDYPTFQRQQQQHPFLSHQSDQPPPPSINGSCGYNNGRGEYGRLNVSDPRYAAKYGNPYLVQQQQQGQQGQPQQQQMANMQYGEWSETAE